MRMRLPQTARGKKIAAAAGVGVTLLLLAIGKSFLSGSGLAFRSDIPKPCRDHLSAVLHVPVERFRKTSGHGAYFSVELTDGAAFAEAITAPLSQGTCRWGAGDPALAESEQDYADRCRAAKSLVAGDKEHTEKFLGAFDCLKQWSKFRYEIARHALAELRPGRLSDVSALEAWLYPAFFATKEADTTTVVEAAEKLAARGSGNDDRRIAAAHLALQARYIGWRRAGSNDSDARLGQLDAAVQSLDKQIPRDMIVAEIKLAIARRKLDAKGLHDAAKQVRIDYPRFTAGDYYLAVAAHESGDNSRALWHLGRILAGVPDDIRASLALKRLQDPNANADDAEVFPDILGEFQGLSMKFRPETPFDEDRALAGRAK